MTRGRDRKRSLASAQRFHKLPTTLSSNCTDRKSHTRDSGRRTSPESNGRAAVTLLSPCTEWFYGETTLGVAG